MQVRKIAIMGAGLVGSLLSIYLKKKGYEVAVYERRPDMRSTGAAGGRSINLAISDRGWKGLAGVGLEETIRKLAIPMHGRQVHSVEGVQSYQPYGKPGQFINSVSRGQLNMELLHAAESLGVPLHFEQRVEKIDIKGRQAILEDIRQSELYPLDADLIIGADGAFSMVRDSMMRTDQFNYSQSYESHSYKELTIPADENTGDFLLEKNALHIWPRKSFMLIALPNLDGSFTVTLFAPTKGPESFETLLTEADVIGYFRKYFANVLPLMPTLAHDFFSNPTGSLMTVKCFPWVVGNNMLIGDAAHAVVPFYGQGMNCGFEDCTVLSELIDQYNHDWSKILPAYQESRKPNADGIADLARLNFVEMRDLVADPAFIFKRRIAAKVSEVYPDRFIPVYSMVSFSHLPYAEALKEYTRQDEVLSEVLKMPQIEEKWDNEYLDTIAKQLLNI
jgi:kynurenine 3-monooxygenase